MRLPCPRIKSTTAEIAKALTGDYRSEHLFVLKQELTLYEVYQKEITAIDKQIEKCLANFEPKTLDQLPDTRTSPFKVLCEELICSLFKRGENIRAENRNVTRTGV